MAIQISSKVRRIGVAGLESGFIRSRIDRNFCKGMGKVSSLLALEPQSGNSHSNRPYINSVP